MKSLRSIRINGDPSKKKKKGKKKGKKGSVTAMAIKTVSPHSKPKTSKYNTTKTTLPSRKSPKEQYTIYRGSSTPKRGTTAKSRKAAGEPYPPKLDTFSKKKKKK